MKDVRKQLLDPLTLNGKWKGGTDIYGTLRQILVEPQTPDTTYDIGIRDEGGYLIYVKYDVTGPLATEDLNIILFPGEKQIIIEKATRDEPFKLKLTYQM